MKNKTAKRAYKAYLRSFRKPWRQHSTIHDLNRWLKSQTWLLARAIDESTRESVLLKMADEYGEP